MSLDPQPDVAGGHEGGPVRLKRSQTACRRAGEKSRGSATHDVSLGQGRVPPREPPGPFLFRRRGDVARPVRGQGEPALVHLLHEVDDLQKIKPSSGSAFLISQLFSCPRDLLSKLLLGLCGVVVLLGLVEFFHEQGHLQLVRVARPRRGGRGRPPLLVLLGADRFKEPPLQRLELAQVYEAAAHGGVRGHLDDAAVPDVRVHLSGRGALNRSEENGAGGSDLVVVVLVLVVVSIVEVVVDVVGHIDDCVRGREDEAHEPPRGHAAHGDALGVRPLGKEHDGVAGTVPVPGTSQKIFQKKYVRPSNLGPTS